MDSQIRIAVTVVTGVLGDTNAPGQDTMMCVSDMTTNRICRIVEKNRAVGWMADNELLRHMASGGWDPVAFRFGVSGLEITFESTNESGPSRWTYDCNQEGGSINDLVRTLDMYMNSHGLELIFCFRAGSGEATRSGGYVRFFARRPALRTGIGDVGWEHRAMKIAGRARARLNGGWTHVATINSYPDVGAKFGIYKRMVPRGP